MCSWVCSLCCPRCVCDFDALWKSFACRVERYLFRMLVVFGSGECVHRFVSLLSSGPHVSGLSRRHVSEHVRTICKNSEKKETTCADAHVSRRFKPWIVRSCAIKLASIQSRDHDRADHHSLRCLWRRVHAVSRVFFVLDVCMCGFPSRWLGGIDVCLHFLFLSAHNWKDVHAMRVYTQELKNSSHLWNSLGYFTFLRMCATTVALVQSRDDALSDQNYVVLCWKLRACRAQRLSCLEVCECVCAFPFWWVCESTDVIVRLCSALEWLVGRLDCKHVHAIRLFVWCEANNVVFDVTWLVGIPALERDDLCHQVVYSPWCVWHFGQWRKSCACRVERYLLRMLVVFRSWDCVHRFVSLLNSGPHLSGLSCRHDCEHVSKNSEGRDTTYVDAHVSRRFKPWIVRTCATTVAFVLRRHDVFGTMYGCEIRLYVATCNLCSENLWISALADKWFDGCRSDRWLEPSWFRTCPSDPRRCWMSSAQRCFLHESPKFQCWSARMGATKIGEY